jgi:hypothetical protein
MSTRLHVLVLVLGVCMTGAVAILLNLVRHRRLRGKYGLLWLTVGITLVPLAVFPGAVDWMAKRVGVEYGPTLIIIATIGLLLLTAMHFSWELSRLEERSRTLAEEVALLRRELADHRADAASGDQGDEIVG